MIQTDRGRRAALLGSLLLCAALVVGPGYAATPTQGTSTAAPGIWGGALQNPYAGNTDAVRVGASMFSVMHCAQCHGSGGTGWVGPSLDD